MCCSARLLLSCFEEKNEKHHGMKWQQIEWRKIFMETLTIITYLICLQIYFCSLQQLSSAARKTRRKALTRMNRSGGGMGGWRMLATINKIYPETWLIHLYLRGSGGVEQWAMERVPLIYYSTLCILINIMMLCTSEFHLLSKDWCWMDVRLHERGMWQGASLFWKSAVHVYLLTAASLGDFWKIFVVVAYFRKSAAGQTWIQINNISSNQNNWIKINLLSARHVIAISKF